MKCMTNDPTPIPKESDVFTIGVTALDCSAKITLNATLLASNLTYTKYATTGLVEIFAANEFAVTNNTARCNITAFSIEAVSGTTPGTWLVIDSTTGKLEIDQGVLGSAVFKIRTTTATGAFLDSAELTVSVSCDSATLTAPTFTPSPLIYSSSSTANMTNFVELSTLVPEWATVSTGNCTSSFSLIDPSTNATYAGTDVTIATSTHLAADHAQIIDKNLTLRFTNGGTAIDQTFNVQIFSIALGLSQTVSDISRDFSAATNTTLISDTSVLYNSTVISTVTLSLLNAVTGIAPTGTEVNLTGSTIVF